MRRLGVALGTLLILVAAGAAPAAAPAAAAGAPPPTKQFLTSLSCTSPDACVAVGYVCPANCPAGATDPLAEEWNGKAWSVMSLPVPTGTKSASLVSVSCSSAVACMAVGQYFDGTTDIKGAPAQLALSERWDGTTWSAQPAPLPAGAYIPELTSVSCAAAGMCIAVGGYTTQPSSGCGGTAILAERWDGTAWTIVPAPSPGIYCGTNVLSSVSCPSVTSCLAVGQVLARGDGTAWSVEQVPTPPEAGAAVVRLASISCGSPTSCVAVGFTSNPSYASAVARWDGTTWTVHVSQGPVPPNPGNLVSVSCAGAADCTAVGTSFTGQVDLVNNNALTLDERWNGAAWSRESTPNLTGYSGSSLTAISCVPAGACVAIGSARNSAGTLPLTAVRNGGAWRLALIPGIVAGELLAVSCAPTAAGMAAKPASCLAVGDYSTASGATPLAERWDGKAWSAQPAPLPEGALSSVLSAVACPSLHLCLAAGVYEEASGAWQTFSARWDGASWSIVPMPEPAHTDLIKVTGMSCSAPDACTVVGAYNSASAVYQPLAERWDGQTWSIQQVPAPPGCTTAAACGTLNAVSCPTATTCLAVGSFAGSDWAYELLAERWDGTAWSILPGLPSTNRGWGWLKSVSCSSATACTVGGGEWPSQFGPLVAMSARWNGRGWTADRTPVPRAATYSELTGLSCPSARACAAILNFRGTSGDAAYYFRTERWNGKRWSYHPAPQAAAGSAAFLSALSCTSPSACIEVGSYADRSGNQFQLMARSNGSKWTITNAPLPTGAEAG